MKVLSDGFLTSFFLRFVFQIRVEIRVYGKGGGFAGLNWGCSGKIFGASASYLGFSALNVFPFFPFLFFFFTVDGNVFVIRFFGLSVPFWSNCRDFFYRLL